MQNIRKYTVMQELESGSEVRDGVGKVDQKVSGRGMLLLMGRCLLLRGVLSWLGGRIAWSRVRP